MSVKRGVGVGALGRVYRLLKECCFRVRVKVDTNANPNLTLTLTLTLEHIL